MKNDDSETGSAVGDGGRRERLTRAARDHLELALVGEDPPRTRYHVRSALQALVIETESEAD